MQLKFILIASTLLSGASFATQAPEKPTLFVSNMSNGLTVDAVEPSSDETEHRDSTGWIGEMQAYGVDRFKLTFKQCGTVVFVFDRQANTYAGISTGRGRTASCRIHNWERRWTIVGAS